MASLGYDLAASTYSPDGRLFQLEYAQKAVDGAPTTLAIKCADGVVLAAETPRPTRLLRPAANRAVERVSRGAAAVGCGLAADCRGLGLRAREEAADYAKSLREEIDVGHLAEKMGLYMQQHTLYSSVRPFGAALILAGCGAGALPALYMVEPTGRVHGYKAVAVGRARQFARTELEKIVGSNGSAGAGSGIPSVEDGVRQAVRILVAARQEDPSARERQVELEVAVVKPGGVIEHVPLAQLRTLSRQALDTINAAMDFEEI